MVGGNNVYLADAPDVVKIVEPLPHGLALITSMASSTVDASTANESPKECFAKSKWSSVGLVIKDMRGDV